MAKKQSKKGGKVVVYSNRPKTDRPTQAEFAGVLKDAARRRMILGYRIMA